MQIKLMLLFSCCFTKAKYLTAARAIFSFSYYSPYLEKLYIRPVSVVLIPLMLIFIKKQQGPLSGFSSGGDNANALA